MDINWIRYRETLIFEARLQKNYIYEQRGVSGPEVDVGIIFNAYVTLNSTVNLFGDQASKQMQKQILLRDNTVSQRNHNITFLLMTSDHPKVLSDLLSE